eukprot:1869211-Heterocapsa_arctica.AAC.1
MLGGPWCTGGALAAGSDRVRRLAGARSAVRRWPRGSSSESSPGSLLLADRGVEGKEGRGDSGASD